MVKKDSSVARNRGAINTYKVNGKSVKVQHSVLLTNEDKSKIEDAIAERLYEIFTGKMAE